MGVQTPSMADNPLFDVADVGSVGEAVFIPAIKKFSKEEISVAKAALDAGEEAKDVWAAHRIAFPRGYPEGVTEIPLYKSESPEMRISSAAKAKQAENTSAGVDRLYGLNRVEDVVENPDLFETFPEAKKWTVKIKEQSAGAGGSAPDEGIEIAPHYMKFARHGELNDLFGHETQHKVSEVSDWPLGGSQEYEKQALEREMKFTKTEGDRYSMDLVASEAEGVENLVENASDKLQRQLDKLPKILSSATAKQNAEKMELWITKAEEIRKKEPSKELDDLIFNAKQFVGRVYQMTPAGGNTVHQQGLENYLRLADEYMARLSGQRAGFSEEVLYDPDMYPFSPEYAKAVAGYTQRDWLGAPSYVHKSDPERLIFKRRKGHNSGMPYVPEYSEGGSVNLYEQALEQYPVLQQYPVRYTERTDIPGHMESWPAGEEGGPEWPRPEELPMDQFGVEVRGTDSRPEDVLGDISSHHLVNVDPVTKDTYTRFAGSMTPEQVGILNEQYQHAVNSGEKRSFEQWASVSGIPAWFRGYTFSQWPEEFTSRAYTPDQTRLLDRLRHYYETGEMPASDFERYTEGYAKGGPVKGYAKGDLVSMYDDYHCDPAGDGGRRCPRARRP